MGSCYLVVDKVNAIDLTDDFLLFLGKNDAGEGG
jgi:hypothetical protein